MKTSSISCSRTPTRQLATYRLRVMNCNMHRNITFEVPYIHLYKYNSNIKQKNFCLSFLLLERRIGCLRYETQVGILLTFAYKSPVSKKVAFSKQSLLSCPTNIDRGLNMQVRSSNKQKQVCASDYCKTL